MGRMSISIHSTHDDPVGFGNLNDLNSAASNDVSSAWAAAIPKFVTRRGAIVGAAGAFGLRRNSLDSEISMSAVRRISVESRASQSRRHSFDSQYSVHSQQTTDLERLTKLHFRHGGRKRNMLRGGRKMALRRRGSITSQASSKGSQILPAITKLAMRTRRGSMTSMASSKGSQILPAITKRRDQIAPLGSMGTTAVQIQPNDKHQSLQKVDLERIERFSLNLPGDGSSDESDIDNGESSKVQAVPMTQATQTAMTWNVATQTSPGLSALRSVVNKTTTKTTQSVSKGTQVTSSSSSRSSSPVSVSPEAVRKSLPKTSAAAAIIGTNVSNSKCHRERGQADGSPNGSSSDLSDHITTSGPGLSSPTQSLLDYLLPIKNQPDKKSDDRQLNGSKNRYSCQVMAVKN